jgi:hypothetical protein
VVLDPDPDLALLAVLTRFGGYLTFKKVSDPVLDPTINVGSSSKPMILRPFRGFFYRYLFKTKLAFYDHKLTNLLITKIVKLLISFDNFFTVKDEFKIQIWVRIQTL